MVGTQMNKVFPVLGNHDFYPVNQMEFLHPESNPTIMSLLTFWDDWLQSDTLKQFKQFGYYSQVLKLDDDSKLVAPQYTKIIALNTLACSIHNFGYFKTLYDPGEQLQWLESELQGLEDAKGQAIIIGHQPLA